MTKKNCTTISLFPKVCGHYLISEDITEIHQLEDYDYVTSDSDEKAYSTESRQVLDNFPKLKSLVLDYFNDFKNNVLELRSTAFQISTSWGTKVLPLGRSHIHNHKNSMYSGILYWKDYQNTELILQDIDYSSFMVLPDEVNIFNMDHFKLNTIKNSIFFFPSPLPHAISHNKSGQIRYSLAFNLWPVGSIGTGDSAVNTKLVKSL